MNNNNNKAKVKKKQTIFPNDLSQIYTDLEPLHLRIHQ